MSTWNTFYEGNQITVENGWSGERLLVNGQLQDEQFGIASRSHPRGIIFFCKMQDFCR